LNRKLANGLPQPLVLFHHPRKGWGVRTAVELKKGEFVCEYVGELVSAAEADRRAERCPDAERYFMALKPSDKPDGHYVVIDAYAVRNVAAFINFSCKPNLRKVSVPATHADSKFPRVGFVAIDTIKIGTELSYTRDDQKYIRGGEICFCGAKDCQGRF